MIRDDLGVRMKTFYEQVPKTKLVRRMPVAIRIDGKAFHTFTRGFDKPFDRILMRAMQETMKYLCENIQGCVFGYTQSDEISLILVDYKKLNSSAWFDYEVQKMCSISASMATIAFNKAFTKLANICINTIMDVWNVSDGDKGHMMKYMKTLDNAMAKGAIFDSRCFNIPVEEVTNLIYWRQLDAIRNSVQMVGQASFSQKQLQGKSCGDIKDMLVNIGDAWENYPIAAQRGSACIKEDDEWIIDKHMPILKGENREYLDKYVRYSAYYEEDK